MQPVVSLTRLNYVKTICSDKQMLRNLADTIALLNAN